MFTKTILGLCLVSRVSSALAAYEIMIETHSDSGVTIVNNSPYVITLDNFHLTIGYTKKPIKLLPEKSMSVLYMHQCRASTNYGAIGYTIEPETELRFGMLEPIRVIRVYAVI